MCSRYLIRASLDPPESISKMAFRSVQLFSIGSAVFAQLTADESLYFTTGHCSSPTNFPLTWGSGAPTSNTWLLGPTQVHNPNGSSTVICCGLISWPSPQIVWVQRQQHTHAPEVVCSASLATLSASRRHLSHSPSQHSTCQSSQLLENVQKTSHQPNKSDLLKSVSDTHTFDKIKTSQATSFVLGRRN